MPASIAFRYATGLLAAGCLFFVAARWLEARGSSFPNFPLPAPGRTVKSDVFVATAGSHELWVEIAENLKPEDDVDGPPLPCRIALRIATPHGWKLLVRSQLYTAATYTAGNQRAYASPSFALNRGRHEIAVSNEGCEPSSSFLGGSARLEHPSPVTVPLSLLALGLAYLSTALGFVALVAAALPGRRPPQP